MTCQELKGCTANLIMFNLSLKSGLVRNTMWMFLGQGLRLVIQALYFIEIARSLGAANYGAFIGVVALVGIAFPFGALGSGNLLVKNVARDRNHFPAYWGRALAVTATSSSVLYIVLLIVSHLALPGGDSASPGAAGRRSRSIWLKCDHHIRAGVSGIRTTGLDRRN